MYRTNNKKYETLKERTIGYRDIDNLLTIGSLKKLLTFQIDNRVFNSFQVVNFHGKF